MKIDFKLIKTVERFHGAIVWSVELDGVSVGTVCRTSDTGTMWINSDEDRAYYGTRQGAVEGLIASMLDREYA